MSSDEPKQNNTDGTSQAARYQINIPDPSIEIRHIGHEFLLKYEASQQENRAYTAKSLFWNRATFCAQWVVAYTGCTLALLSLNYCQLRTSQAANEISRESFVSVQRAYVIVDDVKIVRAADKGPNEPSWFFFPNIRNVGNTQTSELQIRAIGGESLGDQIGSGPRDPDEIFSDPMFTGDTRNYIFGV